MIPKVTIPKYNAKSFGFKTFLSIIISGNDSAVTDIINARAVPRGSPFSRSDCTIGRTPAAFE